VLQQAPPASQRHRLGRVPATMGAWRRVLPLLGPAFVAAIAYVDPGNFATNFAAGRFGYRLLWVIVGANLAAMLIQTLTAKLGTVTGRDLASLCRAHLPRPVTWCLWLQGEAVAVATDLAEVVGGAVALALLFGVPLPVGGLVTAVVAFALLGTHRSGHRRFERVVAALLLVIGAGFAYTLVRSGVDPSGLAAGLVPGFSGADSVVLATGILGATVMPHAIYVHSALTTDRYDTTPAPGCPETSGARVARLLRTQRLDVLLAMGAAGVVNAAMLVVAAQLATRLDVADLGSLEAVHAGLGRTLGGAGALAFAVALLASGLAASSVGTYAGQVVMAGFLRRHVPLALRRCLTLAPALVVLFAGLDPTAALVWSQVVLCLGIPFALVPLIWFTARRDLMGRFVNARVTTGVAVAVAVVIVGLNGYLVTGLLDRLLTGP
jgi:manganese transport protein